MFRNLYRTIQDTVDAKAKTMRSLWRISKRTFLQQESTYKVVKFIVKVKLVEKRVKSHVGRVIVVKVTSQYRIPGRTRARNRIERPINPSQVLEGVPSGVVASAEAWVSAVLEALPMRELSPFDVVAIMAPRGTSVSECDIAIDI